MTRDAGVSCRGTDEDASKTRMDIPQQLETSEDDSERELRARLSKIREWRERRESMPETTRECPEEPREMRDDAHGTDLKRSASRGNAKSVEDGSWNTVALAMTDATSPVEYGRGSMADEKAKKVVILLLTACSMCTVVVISLFALGGSLRGF